MVDFDSYRAEWPYLATSELWLQHAGITPLAERVKLAATRFMDDFGRAPAATYSRLWRAATLEARAKVARLLDTPPEHLALTKNTSVGLATVAEGLTWAPGTNVVTLSGEFPSNRLPWRNLERLGVQVRTVPPDAQGHCPTDAVAALVDHNTSVLAVSWVQYLDGYRQDLAALAEICERHDALLVVDAIQGVGALPLDLEGLDAVVCGGHKWLCGTEGAGFLWLSRRAFDVLWPSQISWHSVGDWIFAAGRELAAEAEMPPLKPSAERFEEGTPNVWGQVMLGEAAEMLTEIGPANIAPRLWAVQDYLLERLAPLGYVAVSDLTPARRSGILSIAHPDHSPAEIVKRLTAERITAIQRGQAVRLAAHFYNNQDDMDRVAAALT